MKIEKTNTFNVRKGFVIWITGLSGSGKTTLAIELKDRLNLLGIPTLLLDGDTIRNILAEDRNEKDYSYLARKKMAEKYSRLSLVFASQGYCVLTSVIGMFKDIYDWNRQNLPGYFEIFLDIPIDELKKRDSKGIYKNFELGNLKNVAGMDLKIQKPIKPDIHIKNSNNINVKEITNKALYNLNLNR